MNKSDFTLIELLVVISIMGIILILVIPRINNFRKEYELKNMKHI